MKLLHGLVVDGYGHLCVSIEGELDVVAGPVLPRRLVTWQLQVFAAPTGEQRWEVGGRGNKDEVKCLSSKEHKSDHETNFLEIFESLLMFDIK